MIAVASVVAAVVVFLLVRGGGSKQHPAASAPTTASTPAAGASSRTSTPTTSATASSTTSAKVVAQINLMPPSGHSSKAAGIAEILTEGSTNGVAIVAQNVPPNTTKPPNAYAVWLYNSPHRRPDPGVRQPGRRQDRPALHGRSAAQQRRALQAADRDPGDDRQPQGARRDRPGGHAHRALSARPDAPCALSRRSAPGRRAPRRAWRRSPGAAGTRRCANSRAASAAG